MSVIWNSPVVLAAIAAICCVLALPLIRVGLFSGATSTALCLGFAIPLFLTGMLEKPHEVPDFGTNRGLFLALVVGIMLSTGFRFIVRAFMLFGTKR
jgi:hypothetical protein